MLTRNRWKIVAALLVAVTCIHIYCEGEPARIAKAKKERQMAYWDSLAPNSPLAQGITYVPRH